MSGVVPVNGGWWDVHRRDRVVWVVVLIILRSAGVGNQ